MNLRRNSPNIATEELTTRFLSLSSEACWNPCSRSLLMVSEYVGGTGIGLITYKGKNWVPSFMVLLLLLLLRKFECRKTTALPTY